MKALALMMAAAAVAFAAPSPPDDAGDHEPLRQERFLERLDQALKLDDKQKETIGKIIEKTTARDKSKIAELQALRKKMKALAQDLHRSNQESREAIRDALNLDQKEKFDALMQRMKRGGGSRGGERRMRGIDMDPDDIPPQMREKMRQGQRDFPPEMWHPGQEGRQDLPPEIRERIRERMERRREQGEGSQRDLPPPDEWHDRRPRGEEGPEREEE